MIRSTALVLSLLPAAALAETEEERAARCEIQAGIAGDAMVLRDEGEGARDAKNRLESGDMAVDERYVPAVAPLVEWVYTLPEEVQDDAVLNAFERQCLKFDP